MTMPEIRTYDGHDPDMMDISMFLLNAHFLNLRSEDFIHWVGNRGLIWRGFYGFVMPNGTRNDVLSILAPFYDPKTIHKASEGVKTHH